MKLRANKINLTKYGSALLEKSTTTTTLPELIALCLKPLNLQAGVHPSHTRAERLAELDKMIGTYGVEGMLLNRRGEDVSGSCSMRDVAADLQYCNAGDTYATTLFYQNGKLYIGDWGSVVESLPC